MVERGRASMDLGRLRPHWPSSLDLSWPLRTLPSAGNSHGLSSLAAPPWTGPVSIVQRLEK